MKASYLYQTTRRSLISCVIFIVVSTAHVCSGTVTQGTIYKSDTGNFTVKLGVIDKGGLAYGSYNNTLFTTGWGELHLYAGRWGNNDVTNGDSDYMYAAGILEGVLTAKEIYQNYQNINATIFNIAGDPKVRQRVIDFMEKQDAWMRGMIKERREEDPFWQGISLIISQFDGLIEGYKMSSFYSENTTLGILAMQILNCGGDLGDLKNALNPSLIPDWDKLSREEFLRYLHATGHCSALIKPLPAYEDVFMAHATWSTYSVMLRIYKHYHFRLSFESNAAENVSFSSYPGMLVSMDDFYIMSSGLTSMETTNNIFNKSLYEFVQPQSLFTWQRARVANMMARNGKEWAALFSRYNSGTYNNQYMVLDRKRIKLRNAILDDALWVVEQVPSLVVSGDQTPILRAGYWPSYNVPFYEEIYNISGYPEQVKRVGEDMTYQLAPRAKIFRRDEGKVVDMDSMKRIMRYNDYKNDPYSEGDPSKTICMRGDLMSSPMAVGCYDAKVSSLAMADRQASYVISGPTLGDGSLPPFEWTGQFLKQPHVGLPPVYNFSFVEMKPYEL